jgi:hypothetical protein
VCLGNRISHSLCPVERYIPDDFSPRDN